MMDSHTAKLIERFIVIGQRLAKSLEKIAETYEKDVNRSHVAKYGSVFPPETAKPHK